MAGETTATVRRRRRAQTPDSQTTHTTTAADAPSNDQQTQRQPETNGAQQPQAREAMRQFVMRMLLMYVLYQYYLKPKGQQQQQQQVGTTTQLSPQELGELVDSAASPFASFFGVPATRVPKYFHVPLQHAWQPGTALQFRVFANMNRHMSFEEALSLGADGAIWHADQLELNSKPSNYLTNNITLDVPHAVSSQNSTWYAHIFVVRDGFFDMQLQDVTDQMVEKNVLYYRHQLVKWLKVDLSKEGKSLLGTDAPESEQCDVEQCAVDEAPDVRYDQVWKPTMSIAVVTSASALKLGDLPPKAALKFKVNTHTREYYPPMEVDEFWVLSDMLRPMNESVKQVTVEGSFSPMSVMKWSVYNQFETVWDTQIQMGTMNEEERDNSKRIFTDTNPVLLGTTVVVSLAHSVLEMLAFKNDISHWKNIKSMEGVSVRSMMWKIVMEAIIFLYLWDNETSWMITVGNGVGLAIAVWKVGKAVKFERFGQRKVFGVIPWFAVSDRESYSQKTKEYDDEAMRYLGYVMYPLVACYALYSLVYEKHKSWYSWVISSLVGAVYAFGFIMMFPQIFINYKLKSVAHMPMKAMMYKTLNTVIDDLFSFIIKMPWLHRVACFRDDVVFVIVLYQRWKYPVDKARVNEFGQQFGAADGESAGKTRS